MSDQLVNRVAVTGSSGFVGTALCRALRDAGWTVVPLPHQLLAGEAEALAHVLRGVRGIVNLAGAPILGRRWSAAYKQTLIDSRVGLTRRLLQAVACCPERPEWLLATSAVGYYGLDRPQSEDDAQPADDFLGRLARDWEAEAGQAVDLGLRTVIFRLGVVLGPGGGALAEMLPVFRLGLGGIIGDGRQPFPWIHRDDVVRAYVAAASDPSWQGVYNLTAPARTSNANLTQALGQALCRPTWFSVPVWALRLRFGEGAVVLSKGQQVIPQRLLERGFPFAYRTIEQAVAACLAG